jgi:hypothetical protein
MRPAPNWLFPVCVSGLFVACLTDYDRFEFDAVASAGSSGSSAAGTSSGGAVDLAGGAAGQPTGDGGGAGEQMMDVGGNGLGGAPLEPTAGAGACEDGATRCNDGCTDVTQDPLHCGGCDVPCSDANVAMLVCEARACAPICEPGFADCSAGDQAGGDGCELDARANAASCGSCANDCREQGNGDGFSCADSRCGCINDANCSAGGLGSATCVQDSRVCSCSGVICVPGEACLQSGLSQVCACNGGSPCQAGHTCCQTPSGCKDLSLDAQNCGACGNACSAGTSCVAGRCQ